MPLKVRIVAADRDEPTPARVHIRAADGRYLPPNGHRREINPGLMEDYGSDLLLGGMPYAYVPGTFEVSVPPGEVHLEVTKGFEYRPVAVSTRVGQEPGELEVRLERPVDMRARGWVTADTHVHFLPPTSGILQAQAEGLNLVNVLSTQWGELFTNVADGYARPVRDERNETEVRVGSENRMHLLGHVSLLGGREREFPLGTGGGNTSPLGDTVDALIADVPFGTAVTFRRRPSHGGSPNARNHLGYLPMVLAPHVFGLQGGALVAVMVATLVPAPRDRGRSMPCADGWRWASLASLRAKPLHAVRIGRR